MKTLVTLFSIFLSINAFAEFNTLECQLRNSNDVTPFTVVRDLNDQTTVNFSRDIGFTQATQSIFDQSGKPLMVTSLLLDDGGKDLVNDFCGVDVDTSKTIEALVLGSFDPADAICMSCIKID